MYFHCSPLYAVTVIKLGGLLPLPLVFILMFLYMVDFKQKLLEVEGQKSLIFTILQWDIYMGHLQVRCLTWSPVIWETLSKVEEAWTSPSHDQVL